MTDSLKEWGKQWLSPGVIMGILGWAVLAVGVWYRVEALEGAIVRLSTDVKASTQAHQEAEKESIRLNDQVGFLKSRLESLERFREAQTDYNAATMSTLAVLKKGG